MGEAVLRDALERVLSGQDLDVASARQVMDTVMEGHATQAQIGALLAGLRAKGESISELTGFVQSLREHATPVEVDPGAIDTCGTGGDGCGTFNVSTAAALVAAGAGCHVAKHGNRSASSRCGSADVLEALGVQIDVDSSVVRRCVDTAGIGFMFAPRFHPALRHAGQARRELGVRTVFNVLGPLANPARVRRQVLGVPEPALARSMAEVLRALGHEHALVVSGADGLDELSLHGDSLVVEVRDGAVHESRLDASSLGLAPAPVAALAGGDAQENARIVQAVLAGEHGAPRDVVLLNAAAAIVVGGLADSLASGMEQARESIDSGAAAERLHRLATESSALAA